MTSLKVERKRQFQTISNFPAFRIEVSTPITLCFPGGSASKVSACNAGEAVSICGWEDSPKEGNDNPLQEILAWQNAMDRGAWWATVHRVTKSLRLTLLLLS